VIQRATSFAAALMGADKDYGTVSVGKYADVIAVRGDPLRHMGTLSNPAIVLKHGVRYR
jgi:imidazolonepropionase-like amidohydrolase